MYIVECDGKVIHGPGSSEVLISNPILTTSLTGNGSLAFDLPPVNPIASYIKPMRSTIKVLDDYDELWRGRVLNFESDFNLVAPIDCEGLIGYLNDSLVRPDDADNLDPEWEIPEYLNYMLEIHNDQVEEFKKIYLGDVTVTFPESELYDPGWSITDRVSTKSMVDALQSKFGGYFRIRMDGERILLDYLKEFIQEATQEIVFAKNLMNLKKTITGDKLKTAIVPLGKNGLTIEDVNPTGFDYISDDEAVQQYGFIIDTVKYEEIEDEEELYTKALGELPKHTGIQTTLSVTAFDLSLVDKRIEAFKVGDLVRIISPPHGLNELIQVSEIRLNLTEPDKSEITLGDPIETLTGRSSK